MVKNFDNDFSQTAGNNDASVIIGTQVVPLSFEGIIRPSLQPLGIPPSVWVVLKRCIIGLEKQQWPSLIKSLDIQYKPKTFCLTGGRRYPPLSARGRLCLQAPFDSTLVTPQYDTPSIWANMN